MFAHANIKKTISIKYVKLLRSRLLIILCIHQFFTAHSTYSFLVRAGLAIMGPHLVNFLSAYSTDLKFRGIRIESCFSRRKSFILTDLTTSALRRVPCTRLPGIRSNNFAQFLFAFLANHVEIFLFRKRKLNTCLKIIEHQLEPKDKLCLNI